MSLLPTRRVFWGLPLFFPFLGEALAQPTGSNTAQAPIGPASGDLSGTYPNPTVVQINGVAPGPAATAVLGQIPGATSSTGAIAGNIGEYTTASLGTASPVALVTTGTVTSIVSLTLSAGDWDVWGSGIFQAANTAVGWKQMAVAVSNASTTFPAMPAPGMFQLALSSAGATSLTTTILATPQTQFISSAVMTAWLVANALASAGVASCNVYGIIQARRRR